jgi:hypothetical protein
MSSTALRLTPQTLRTLALGVLSLALYIVLFSFEAEVLALSTAGGWAFLVPIGIAFVFSFVHGAFTSGFWDMLGLKAKTRKEPKRWSK